MIKISIITINYNNLNGLKKTMESVFNQSWQNIEYIVIDGGSTDGSVQYIEQQQHKITYWESKKDNGVYHAMNKGIEKATGEYLIFLNSGDHFYNDTILNDYHEHIGQHDIVYFNLNVIDNDESYTKTYPKVLSFSYFVEDTLPHPASFIKRKLFNDIGCYDESLKITADWKFFMDAICKCNKSYKHVNALLSTFYFNGMSSMVENRSIINQEKIKVLKDKYAVFFKDIDEVIKNKTQLIALRKSRTIKLLVKLGFLNKF